ncbi:MAG TPA: NADH:ubiquinone oxidoreductase [Bacteroidales bacterium]|jgi:NADH:ubiquinone oxidoreductase subunit E|nr:NADH:ubiquinone oxidoreductase [Bacteroidales bacterium]
MSERVEFEVCLGSSCFSRGNKNILKTIEDFIKENNLSEKVNLNGSHCLGNCVKGPNIKVNGKLHSGIDRFKITGILRNTFDI